MSVGAVILLALQGLPATASPCEKLMREFAINENTFGIIHDVDQALLDADKRFADATGDYSAIGPGLRKNEESSERFRIKGDRIVTLMAGQGCPLPDHVTSPITYQRDRAVCKAAKGMPSEHEACGFIDRAVASALLSQSKRSKRR